MHHRNILYVSYTTEYHEMMRQVTVSMDVSVLRSTPEGFTSAITSGHNFDLVILQDNNMSPAFTSELNQYCLKNGLIPMLFIESEKNLRQLKLPSTLTCDFILEGASQDEFEIRISRLLWPNEEHSPSDILTIDNMTINLATYQVVIDNKPVDLTLMEYSLLSFLLTHPGRAYTRETLLHRVWGFEYCGGTRTVDVHIRRVRAKVGPQIASHIQTVRGVGYMFKH